MLTRATQQRVEQVADVRKRHRLDDFCVRADDHHRCVGRHLVQRLQPHLQPAHVTGEEVLGPVVMLQGRQVDQQQRNVGLNVARIFVQNVTGKRNDRHVRRYVTDCETVSGRITAGRDGLLRGAALGHRWIHLHVELNYPDRKRSFRIGQSTQSAIVLESFDQGRLTRSGFAEYRDCYVFDVVLSRCRSRQEVVEFEISEQSRTRPDDTTWSDRQVERIEPEESLQHVEQRRRDPVDPIMTDVQPGQIDQIDHLSWKSRDAVSATAEDFQIGKSGSPRDVLDLVIRARQDFQLAQTADRLRQGRQTRPLGITRERLQLAQQTDIVWNLFQVVPVDLENFEKVQLLKDARRNLAKSRLGQDENSEERVPTEQLCVIEVEPAVDDDEGPDGGGVDPVEDLVEMMYAVVLNDDQITDRFRSDRREVVLHTLHRTLPDEHGLLVSVASAFDQGAVGVIQR